MGIFGNSASVFDQQLDKATDECNTEEDWGLIMTICDKVKTTPDGPREFCRAILKKINHKVPHVSLQALTILDSCVNNCGMDFKKEVSSQEFISSMKQVITNGHPKVATHFKMLIRQWADDFKDEAQLSRLTSFYHFMRSEGVEFPTKDEVIPKKKSAPVSKDPNVVSSQQEADDIAKAIEMSLKEEQQKKGLSNSLSMSSTGASAPASSLYPSMLGGAASTSTFQSTSYTSGTTSEKKKTVKAIYDFEAAEDNELTFKAGDLIEILDDSDVNWWKGQGSNGAGYFPVNFVTTDLSVEPEPEFGVVKKEEDEEDGRSVSFNEDVEVKEVDLSEPVLEIDEALMDKTLIELQNTDPESDVQDSPELVKDEDTCTQMGPLIDAKLQDVDRKHLEFTQLNDKILEALNMYDRLMNEMPMYKPSVQNPYMNSTLPGMNPYGQQVMSGATAAGYHHHAMNPNMYGQSPQMQQGPTASSSNQQIPQVGMQNSASYMYTQQGPAPVGSSYQNMQQLPQAQQQGVVHQTQSDNEMGPQSYHPTSYADPSMTQSHPSTYSNQNQLPQQQSAPMGYPQSGGPVPSGHPYNVNMPTMQPLM